MRLLKECYLHELEPGTEFLLDGAWYEVQQHLISSTEVLLLTEYYKAEDESKYLLPGDTAIYSGMCTVITEVPD